MNILVCHERFLFRFGADRVMMLLGKGLADLGHHVTMMANRLDRQVLESFACRIIEAPADGEYKNLNEFTAEWLRRTWAMHFDEQTRPDIVLNGGWPFFASIPLFREKAAEVIFLDCGVVPLEGYSDGIQATLGKLKDLRQQNLKQCSLITPISEFIGKSQSVPDSEGLVPVRKVHCGADHMEMSMWQSAQISQASSVGHGLALVESLKRGGKRLIFNMGRWEPGCYKSSDNVFDIIRTVSNAIPDAVLLVLAADSDVKVPADLQGKICCMGFPDDRELIDIMKLSDLGISVSLWEGFNLPLAEMQWLDRPALALDIGAHPEVILHPWYLCRDTGQMAAKIVDVLKGRGPNHATRLAALERFRAHFTWSRATQEYQSIIAELDRANTKAPSVASRDSRVSLIMDVTNATRDPANSGVIRLTRRAARTLQTYRDPLFVVWDSATGRYVLPTREEFRQLGEFNGPLLTGEDRLSPYAERRVGLDEALAAFGADDPWLLMTETIIESQFQYIRHYARARNLRMAAVFHDAIPVLRPDLCNEEMTSNHEAYMRGLAECDVILPNSPYSAKCLMDLWKQWGVNGCKVVANSLPGEFGGVPRNQAVDLPLQGPVNILMVSTLEPRKNHRTLINACLGMQRLHPELDWSLTLIGNRYAGAYEIADFIEATCRNNSRIRWLGIVDDATLARMYREATFTAYPSIIEGFGIPIVESIWYGRPCLCANQGVMAELAAGGGCLTTDVGNEAELAQALYRLATDRTLLLELAKEAVARPLKTWTGYAHELLGTIVSHDILAPRPMAPPSAAAEDGLNWEEVLYPKCLTENWQMNHSERLALTGILARLKPHCSIEVGTYLGGSLSLIAQYSEIVISIDTDPLLPAKLNTIPRVSFLTGNSHHILPVLLRELNDSNMPVQFVLIDGDHSADGIKRDVGTILNYVPKEPMIVLMHDSANPGCRSGMVDAGWERSPYCHLVDLDLVPGRIMENGGAGTGEMWGGLAMAYFLPTPRTKELVVSRSADQMMCILKAASKHQ